MTFDQRRMRRDAHRRRRASPFLDGDAETEVSRDGARREVATAELERPAIAARVAAGKKGARVRAAFEAFAVALAARTR